MSNLPDKPSELIRVALADLEKCEASPSTIVDMGYWHALIGDDERDEFESELREKPKALCVVCLAGSVISKTLSVEDGCDAGPGTFDEPIRAKLMALDEFRMGWVGEALITMGLRLPPTLFDSTDITPYHVDPGAFRRDMRQLADDLEADGL